MSATIALALVVLIGAALLLAREVLSMRKRNSIAPPAPSEPPARTPSLAPAEADEGEDVDLTAIGSAPPRKALPSLQLTEEDDEQSSRSEAITLFEDQAELDEPTSPSELFVVAAVAQSDTGKRRKRNEDSYLISDEHGLFLVADGMGGAAGGDIASKLAVTTVGEAFRAERFPVKTVDQKRPVYALQFVSAIEAAHNAVVKRATDEPDLHGMGTTLVGARFLRKKRRVYVAHVGDSRCYRLRDGALKLLTTDHTFTAKGMDGPMANRIRRAVGIGKRVKVDMVVDIPKPGDLYLLCSDGLNKMVDDESIRKTMLDSLPPAPDATALEAVAERLVEEANAAGGRDNVTALVARVIERPQHARS